MAMTSDLRPGQRVCCGDGGKPGIVIAVRRKGQVKVLWPDYVSRWHEAETLTRAGDATKGDRR